MFRKACHSRALPPAFQDRNLGEKRHICNYGIDVRNLSLELIRIYWNVHSTV